MALKLLIRGFIEDRKFHELELKKRELEKEEAHLQHELKRLPSKELLAQQETEHLESLLSKNKLALLKERKILLKRDESLKEEWHQLNDEGFQHEKSFLAQMETKRTG